jgi:hypothetical protein
MFPSRSPVKRLNRFLNSIAVAFISTAERPYQRRKAGAHGRREKAVNRFVDPDRVIPFEGHKPIVGGNQGMDRTQVFQSIANFTKMDLITLLQLGILESHKALGK